MKGVAVLDNLSNVKDSLLGEIFLGTTDLKKKLKNL